MISLSLITLAFSSAALAQTTQTIPSIEAHFTGADIVPSFLPTFTPSAILGVNFAGVGDIQPGQALKKEQVGTAPTLTVTPANSSVELTGKYTLAMVDPGHVGADLSPGVTRHWLVNGVTVDNGKVANSSATAITNYAGPAPPEGDGPHRYIILLYAQPDSFKAPEGLDQPTGVSAYDFGAYVKDSGLGDLVAGNYYTVEEGTSTASIAATSAVVSSTLASASAGASSSKTDSASGNQPTQSSPAGNDNGAVAENAPLLMVVGALAASYLLA